jgi:hypothetical protein
MKYLKYIPVLTLAWTAQANAAMTINVSESAGSVVAVSTGNINLIGLPLLSTERSNAWVIPNFPLGSLIVLKSNDPEPQLNLYGGISGPSSFGTGGMSFASSGSGDEFGIIANYGIYVPAGYVSGNPISATSTWDSKTIAGLGLAPGSYTWTWGSGANADSATLNVVPEPTSMLLSMVAGGMMLIRRKR